MVAAGVLLVVRGRYFVQIDERPPEGSGYQRTNRRLACGGRADLRWLFVGGTEVVSDNRLPGVDLAELAVQARVAVSGLLSRL